MKKKLLTIEDLISYCENQNLFSFNSKDSGYQICVQIPVQFEEEESDDEDLFVGNIRLLHTGRNNNGSNVTYDAAKNCLSTIPYKPILANFTDVNGEWDFTTHEFEINDDGSITYIEKQVGCFTADKPYMKEDEKEKDRHYVYAKCAIPKQYTQAAEIIKRKGGTDISAEIAVNKMSYDSKEKELYLEDIVVMGCTLLGVDPNTGNKIGSGMKNARLEIADFSVEKNSVFSKCELIEEITQAVIEKLDDHITAKFVNNNQGKEECGLNKEEFEAKTTEEETPEVVTNFDGEDPVEPAEPAKEGTEKEGDDAGYPTDVATAISALTDASTEADVVAAREAYDSMTEAQKEEFDADVLALLIAQEDRIETAKNEAAASTVTTMISALSDSSSYSAIEAARAAYDALTDAQKELIESSTLKVLEEQETRVLNETSNEKAKKKNYSVDYTVNMGDVKKEFSVSLMEKLNALYELVNATYGESDNTWYDIDAYDDEKIVIMHDYWNNKHYKQSYAVKKDVYSLKGDRVEVFCTFLTRDEQAKLDEMKMNYSLISDKLNKYESEPEKMEILNSADYASIADQADFAELKKQESHFDLSIDELKSKADAMLLQYAKSGKINFSSTQKDNEPKKDFFAFARVGRDTSFLDGLLKK